MNHKPESRDAFLARMQRVIAMRYEWRRKELGVDPDGYVAALQDQVADQSRLRAHGARLQ